MSREIDTVTLGAVEDRRLVLGNACVSRVLNIGTWTTLRIGVRFSITDFTGVLYGVPRFCIGLTSNPSGTNGIQEEVTGHYVGFRTGNTFQRAITAGVTYYNTGTNGIEFCSKVGTTVTSLFASGTNNLSASPSTNIWPIFIELTKSGGGSPANWSMRLVYWNQAPNNDTITKAEMLTAMATADATALAAYMNTIVTGNVWTNSAVAGTIAVDEATNGALNAVTVAWDRANPKIHISDIMYRKIA